MQTAGIRSLLEPEYEFEFVEGRWPHLEGNWSLHTVDFSKSNVSTQWLCFGCWATMPPTPSGSPCLLKCLLWSVLKEDELPTISVLIYAQAVWVLQYVGHRGHPGHGERAASGYRGAWSIRRSVRILVSRRENPLRHGHPALARSIFRLRN